MIINLEGWHSWFPQRPGVYTHRRQMGEVSSKLSILLHRIAGTGFGLHRMGECKVCTEHLHLLLPLRAAEAGLLTLPLHSYWGGNNVVPTLQKMQSHCFASTVSIIPLVGYGPKRLEVLHVTVQSGCETPGWFRSFPHFHFCALSQQNGSNNCTKKASPLLSLAGQQWLMRL